MSTVWSWASLAGSNSENSQHCISKVAPHLSTCPRMQDNGQVDKSLQPLEYIAADWQEYYNERAGVAEYDGRMPKDKAKRMAFESCITRWLDTHLSTINSDLCAHCGMPIGEAGKDSIATANGYWLHHACHAPWLVLRRQNAMEALNVLLCT